jgi:NAD-dependent deacetylase
MDLYAQSLSHVSEIEQAAKLLGNIHSAIAFTGAGLSTSSGIPDFRSPGTGLWARMEASLEEEPFDGMVHSFARDPQKFYERMRPLFQTILAAEPNTAHYALADMEKIRAIHAVITQNADMLHQRAGSRRVIEVHGTLAEATCIHCYKVFPYRPLLERFFADGQVPTCNDCGGVLKPNVILTGEELPAKAVLAARQAIRQCDVLLAAGTSLAGGPATALAEAAHAQGTKLIIVNLTPTLMDTVADVVIRADVVTALPAIASILFKERGAPVSASPRSVGAIDGNAECDFDSC